MAPRKEVNRNDVPPDAGKVLSIRKLKPDEVFTCVVLSDCPQGYDLHWHPFRKHHVRCFRQIGTKDCEGCVAKFATDWLAFMVATDRNLTGQFLVQMTDFGGRQCLALRKEFGTMRGLVIALQKERQNKAFPR